jgi:hypothetical protein
VPRSKPTEAQRYYMAGYAKNSVMDRLSAEERKQLKAKMKRAAEDGSAFERTIRWGSEPRHG